MKQLLTILLPSQRILVTLAPFVIALGLATPVRAIDRTVTSAADDGAADTLRSVIGAANAEDNIIFDPALNGQTISLVGGELVINKILAITGPGPNNLAIVNLNGRVFHTEHVGPVVMFRVSSLRLTGLLKGAPGVDGQAGAINGTDGEGVIGGCILNESQCSLVASNCFFDGCQAVGGNGGQGYNLGIKDPGNGGNGGMALGGAIYSPILADAQILNCTFAGNAAIGGQGGNGYNSGTGGQGGPAQGGALISAYSQTILIVNSTFHGNSATGGSGGNGGDGWLLNPIPANGGNGGGGGDAEGGAIAFPSGACPAPDCPGLVHDTIHKNSIVPGQGKKGGLGVNGGANGNDALHGTARGGGLFREGGGHLPIQNTIIAGNFATISFPGGNFTGPDVHGVMVSQKYNLIGIVDGDSSGWEPAGSDLTGTSAAPIDPLLGPLQNNGGNIPTLAPTGCSPAIDSGTASAFTEDQVFQPRPVSITALPHLLLGGDGSDIGAFELQSFPSDAPTISISLVNDSIILEWPPSFSCFTLQSSVSLFPDSWVNVSETVSIVGNRSRVVTPRSTGKRFFRLIHP